MEKEKNHCAGNGIFGVQAKGNGNGNHLLGKPSESMQTIKKTASSDKSVGNFGDW